MSLLRISASRPRRPVRANSFVLRTNKRPRPLTNSLCFSQNSEVTKKVTPPNDKMTITTKPIQVEGGGSKKTFFSKIPKKTKIGLLVAGQAICFTLPIILTNFSSIYLSTSALAKVAIIPLIPIFGWIIYGAFALAKRIVPIRIGGPKHIFKRPSTGERQEFLITSGILRGPSEENIKILHDNLEVLRALAREQKNLLLEKILHFYEIHLYELEALINMKARNPNISEQIKDKKKALADMISAFDQESGFRPLTEEQLNRLEGQKITIQGFKLFYDRTTPVDNSWKDAEMGFTPDKFQIIESANWELFVRALRKLGSDNLEGPIYLSGRWVEAERDGPSSNFTISLFDSMEKLLTAYSLVSKEKRLKALRQLLQVATEGLLVEWIRQDTWADPNYVFLSPEFDELYQSISTPGSDFFRSDMHPQNQKDAPYPEVQLYAELKTMEQILDPTIEGHPGDLNQLKDFRASPSADIAPKYEQLRKKVQAHTYMIVDDPRKEQILPLLDGDPLSDPELKDV